MHENTTSMEPEGAEERAPLTSSDPEAPRETATSAVNVHGVVNLVVPKSVANDPPTSAASFPQVPPVAPDELHRPKSPPPSAESPPAARGQAKKHPNNLRKLRIERMMSKAELARRANLSVLTIDRIEKGFGCRMDSKRKILEALDLSLADRVRVFGEEE